MLTSNFSRMFRNAFILIFLLFFLHISNASSVFHIRKLVSGELNTTSGPSQVAPAGSPISDSKSNPVKADKEIENEKGSQMTSQSNNSNYNQTSPIASKESKINDNDNTISGNPNPAEGNKTIDKVDDGHAKADNLTSINNGSCELPITSCKDREMLACIEASKDGSQKVFLTVINEGGSTLKVNVNLPNSVENAVPPFEVHGHGTKKVDISTVVQVPELIVNSGNAKCVLPLVNRISVDNFIQQLSFYSKQVTPVYAAYAFFLLTLLSGGTWACCRFRKRSRQDGIPYQELEMGVPESASAGNADVDEGWDHDWDDDWDEDNAVKSPGGHQVRNISADGLVSRSPKKDGWENDWED